MPFCFFGPHSRPQTQGLTHAKNLLYTELCHQSLLIMWFWIHTIEPPDGIKLGHEFLKGLSVTPPITVKSHHGCDIAEKKVYTLVTLFEKQT